MSTARPVPVDSEPVQQPTSAELRKVENSANSTMEELVDENADSTDSNVRYTAYLRRITDVARSAQRYTAYTSDIGEAFRPVVPPALVTAAYGISWAYLIGDVSFTTYKARQLGPSPLEMANMSEPTRLGLVAVKRSVFQGVASMALPAFTIHTAVKQTSNALVNSKNITLKRWGPTAVGIGIVPALPYLFDHPVETAVDWGFEKIEAKWFKSNHPNLPVPSNEPINAPKREL